MPTITLQDLRAALGDQWIEGAEYKLRESHSSPRSQLTLTGYRYLDTISVPGVESVTKMQVYTNAPKPKPRPKPKPSKPKAVDTSDSNVNHHALGARSEPCVEPCVDEETPSDQPAT